MANRTENHLEQEIKARLADPDKLRDRLRAEGARLVHPSGLEVNDLFDLPEGFLRAAGRVLRIRFYEGQATLTLKGRASLDRGLKVRTEHETAVADGEALERIIKGLGFVRKFRYEKYREVWTFDGLEVVIDRTPMGTFVEIEGEGDRVREFGASLGLAQEDLLERSYATLWSQWRADHPEASVDMLFDPPPPGEPAP